MCSVRLLDTTDFGFYVFLDGVSGMKREKGFVFADDVSMILFFMARDAVFEPPPPPSNPRSTGRHRTPLLLPASILPFAAF